jgi:hypothetical protein
MAVDQEKLEFANILSQIEEQIQREEALTNVPQSNVFDAAMEMDEAEDKT